MVCFDWLVENGLGSLVSGASLGTDRNTLSSLLTCLFALFCLALLTFRRRLISLFSLLCLALVLGLALLPPISMGGPQGPPIKVAGGEL